ncbi:MAG: hypothetical protein R2736_13315 [Solirubrobacterales bacterium]
MLDVPVLAETDLDTVVATIAAERARSASSTRCRRSTPRAFTGAPGSVGQVREVAGRIARVAKEIGTAVLLVGHVTKEGALAGPRVLEHLVDCVLQFEGERERTYRTLRALKNRFGSTNEAGVFEMRSGGLVEVLDASGRFVGEATRAPGSVVLASMEGTRPLLVEVQALVSPSGLVPPRQAGDGGSTATASRWCSPCSRAMRACRPAVRTCSSASWAACASKRARGGPRRRAGRLASAVQAHRSGATRRCRSPASRGSRADGRAAVRSRTRAAHRGGGEVRPDRGDRAARQR